MSGPRKSLRSSATAKWLAPWWLATAIFIPTTTGRAATFPAEPLAISAEYYFSRHDFKQSYELWLEVLKRTPDSAFATLRVSELKLMYEGRVPARDLLIKYLENSPKTVSADNRREVREKLKTIESTFISDEGLSLHLQAASKIKRKDCTGALQLLERAQSLEAGNLRIFLDKGFCEKNVGAYDRFYETLKLAYASDPYDREVAENLLDGHIYFKQFALVLDVLNRTPELASSLKGKTAMAVSLTEVGRTAEALPLLQTIMDQQKQIGFHPVLLYSMGRILSDRIDASVEASSYLERFLAASPREFASPEAWDIYRCQERAEEAKAILVKLKARG